MYLPSSSSVTFFTSVKLPENSPLYITASLSLNSNTSFRSADISSTAQFSSLLSSINFFLINSAAPTSIPLVGWLARINVGFAENSLATTTF